VRVLCQVTICHAPPRLAQTSTKRTRNDIALPPELTLIATVQVGDGPGWAELADHDRVCLIANTRSDDVSFVSVAEHKELARLKVGDGPKHINVTPIPLAVLEAFKAAR